MKGTLRSKRQVQEVDEKGLKAVGRHVVAFALSPSPDPVEWHVAPDSLDARGISVGIVASRKVGNAVARGRAKRVLRAALLTRRAYLPANLWLVLVARRSIVDPGANSELVGEELDRLFSRLDLTEGEKR